MKLSGKVIAAILVVAVLAGAALLAQKSVSTPKSIVITSQDLEAWVKDVFPPAQQQQLASDPEKKKSLIKDLRTILAVAQHAEREGYADRPDLKSQLDIQSDLLLRDAYEKKNPGVQVSDEEVNSYHQSNPAVFNSFMDSNPRLKQQAQGPQLETLKKEFGEIKILAARARQEGFEKERINQLRVLLNRSQMLYQAYMNEYQQGLGDEENDAAIKQYLAENKDKFKRVRHILVSTEPTSPPPPADPAAKKEGEDAAPKGLTKEEARQKAQSLLDRIRKGEDFATLAKENSDDPGSKEEGGDLGLVTEDDPLVPEFKTVAFALKPGEVSDLVETQFGFHIIKVEDIGDSVLENPQTKEKIAQAVTQEKIKKHTDELVAASNVEVAEDFNLVPAEIQPAPAIGAPAPPPPGGQPPTNQ